MPWATVEPNIKLIPGVTLEQLKGVGHMPPVEASEAFNTATIKFLEG
jgi:pimeloyl-ACP methyl ester carboxylesterase